MEQDGGVTTPAILVHLSHHHIPLSTLTFTHLPLKPRSWSKYALSIHGSKRVFRFHSQAASFTILSQSHSLKISSYNPYDFMKKTFTTAYETSQTSRQISSTSYLSWQFSTLLLVLSGTTAGRVVFRCTCKNKPLP